MLLTRNGYLASVTCLLALILIVSGCNQPSSQSIGKSVDLSVPETISQTETATPNQASVSRGEEVNSLVQPQKITNKKIATLPQATASPSIKVTPKPADQQNKPVEQQNKPVEQQKMPTDQQNKPTEQQIDKTSTTKPTLNIQMTETPSPSPDLKVDAVSEQEKEIPFIPVNGLNTLLFKELYSKITVRGIELSQKLKSLNNAKVEMTGYMAPPLSAEVNFFVLAKVALSVCPFCSSSADWPVDIVVVYMPKGKSITPTEHPIKVTGTLSVGSQTDEATGFVSLIRIQADEVEELK